MVVPGIQNRRDQEGFHLREPLRALLRASQGQDANQEDHLQVIFYERSDEDVQVRAETGCQQEGAGDGPPARAYPSALTSPGEK